MIFDEVELYYHPEMQRLFIHYLIEALESVQFKHLRGINIILATHSPFILSDIPISNILRLGADDIKDEETYGANIIDILGSSFFLEYTIGEEVRQKILHIATLYQEIENPKAIKDFQRHKHDYAKIISMIGDNYLRESLNGMLCELKNKINCKNNV